MDYRDTVEEADFRSRLRAWIEEHAPALPDDAEARRAAIEHWHRELYAGGWIGLTFPVEYGGHGLAPAYEAILNDELGAAGAPPPPAIGHISNAVRLFGTDEQRAAWLPGMLASTVRWCQGFSEPDAGSDLAGITTRAERVVTPDGAAVYRIDGRKIWTSEAMWSQWCLLLCRTEHGAAAHRSMSMLAVPMHTAGVEARPIVTAYGSEEFAEVTFESAEVPAANLLGTPGQGWAIAMALLGYERGPSDIGWVARLARLLTQLEDDIRSGVVEAGPAERRAVADVWCDVRALQLQVQRTVSARLDGSTPGPEGSIDKLLMTRVEQRLSHVNLQLRGAAALTGSGESIESYFWSRAQSIFGGTQQIQRNIVAQRVLGLPRQ